MAKVLYSIKIWLFRSQFKLTAKEEIGVRDIVIFSVQLYAQAWITAPSAIAAPLNDLQLMNNLLQYSSVHPGISAAIAKKFSNHLWYLSEELIGLALFDSRVFSSTKRLMVESISKQGTDAPMKHPEVSLETFPTRTLDSIVTSNSMNLFHCLQLPTDFLSTDPDTWEIHDAINAKRRLSTFKVVNDSADRGLALIQDYNKTLTKHEDQLQFLLQVVADHHRQFPSTNKSVLTGSSWTKTRC